MQIICSKEELFKGVQSVQLAVSGKNVLPILNNILIESDSTSSGSATLIATDLETGIKCTILAEVKETGSITVPSKKFFDITRELPSNRDIEIYSKKNNELIITCDKINFKIMGMPKDEFPVLPEISKANTFDINQGVLKEAIKKTSFAVSNDETRYVLNGLCIQGNGSKIEIIATDGRRLAMVSELEVGKISGKKINVIVPSKAISQLNHIIGDNEEAKIHVMVSENQVCFKSDKTVLVSRLIEGHFPNYEQVIPKSSQIDVIVNTAELLSAIKRVSLLSSERSEAVKISIQKGKMIISSSTQGVGEASEEIELSYKGDDFEAAYNPFYIIDVLKNIDSDEIVLQLTNSLSPGIIKPNVKKDGVPYEYLTVIMPMRL